MKIGLVARCLNAPHVRGMGRYLQELLVQSVNTPNLHWCLLGDDPFAPVHAPSGVQTHQEVFAHRGDRFQLWEQLGLPRRAAALGLDVLHCTEGSACWWQPVPTVITLHDTIAWTENDGRPFTRFYWNTLMPAALRKAAAVITISEHSKRDILARWPDLASKVTVIPHGIGEEYLRGAQTDLDLQLVVCGFSQSTHQEALRKVPINLQHRVHLAPFLSNQELLALYRGAEAVLYPTLYEGFGFPAIEAQAAGVPAIFSPVSSLTELVGPLALTPAVDSLPAWVHAVQQARALRPQREELADQARRWAGAFSWTRSAEMHVAVYRQAARELILA